MNSDLNDCFISFKPKHLFLRTWRRQLLSSSAPRERRPPPPFILHDDDDAHNAFTYMTLCFLSNSLETELFSVFPEWDGGRRGRRRRQRLGPSGGERLRLHQRRRGGGGGGAHGGHQLQRGAQDTGEWPRPIGFMGASWSWWTIHPHLESHGVTWSLLESPGVIWSLLESHGVS